MTTTKTITIRMPKEALAKWLAALRSGKYKQGTKRLQTQDGGYCCLGVLQKELSGDVERNLSGDSRGTPTIAWLTSHKIRFANGDYDRQTAPYLPSLSQRADAANDDGYTFCEIAAAIEQCSEGF